MLDGAAFFQQRTIRSNRAPALNLWAAVVAERLSFGHDTALTLRRAVAGLNAHSKGVSLGLLLQRLEQTVGVGGHPYFGEGPADNLFVDDRHKLLKIAPESLPRGRRRRRADRGRLRHLRKDRDLFEVARNFAHFFAHKSCGFCTPCRVGTNLLRHVLDKVAEGRGSRYEINELMGLAELLRRAVAGLAKRPAIRCATPGSSSGPPTSSV